MHVRFSKGQKILRIKLDKFAFIWKFIIQCTGHVWWEQKQQNGEIKHYLSHLQQFGYHRSKVKYKVISICIWPLLSSAQIHKEHSNTKSLYVWPGEGCVKRGTWHPGPYCPKLNLVQHSPWGLAAIPSTISCLEQKECLGRSNLLGYTTSWQWLSSPVLIFSQSLNPET